MDIKFLLNNIHQEVSCSQCVTTYINPKQLSCLHSFCLHCLEGILRTSGRHDIITCPKCRKESRVPPESLNKLPTSFRINSLLDVLAIKEHVTTAVKCGNCDKKSHQGFYCFHCCAFWCKANCISLHNGIRANKEHLVMALKDFQDEDFENVLKRPEFCQIKHHEKYELKFFCKICEIPICDACALTDHEGHNNMPLEQAGNERKLLVKSVIESLKENVQRERNKIAEIDKTCLQIKEKAANFKEKAQKFVQALICVIEAKKQEICNEAENQAAESIQRLVAQKSEVEDRTKMTETVIEQTETLVERGTSAEIVKLNKSLGAIFQEEVVNNQREIVDCDLEARRRFMFVENETLMDKVNAEGIGSFKIFHTSVHQLTAEGKGTSEAIVGLKAQVVLTTRNAEGEQCYDERVCITVEIRNHQGQDCATQVRVQDNKDGSYKISYFAKVTGKCDLSVKVNGEQIHGSPFVVTVKQRQYRPVLSFGQRGSNAGMLSAPWGVAVNQRDEITVTENGNNRIQLFNSDGTHLRSFGRKGDKNGEFNFPCGIGFDKNGNIMVADGTNNRVQCFSDQGKHLNTFSSRGYMDHQLSGPHGLSVNNDENIVVADRGNKLIKIFHPNGQFLCKIGGGSFTNHSHCLSLYLRSLHQNVESSFTFPFHCVQYENYIVVSDSEEHCIKVFNTAGKFLYKFGKKGKGDGEFNAPRCLSVNKAGHLMVCDLWNHRVQVFELSGNFVAKFGTKGSGRGEFDRPMSTAVLSDGRIVVTDYGNSRIQIFE